MVRAWFASVLLFSSICSSYAFWKEVVSLIPDAVNPLNLLHTNRCIEDLGCFYTGSPFYHPLHRPISLPPTYNVGTKFHLFTPEQPEEKYDLVATRESVLNSTFDASRETKFLIHGFMTELDYEDLRFAMKNSLLRQGDYNVIVVDWTANNGIPYSQAVANTRVTGANLAKLVNFLIDDFNLSPAKIHIIGHSLGAHVAGYAGERIPNLARITGLDPAGPLFTNMGPEVRLDETDALFVDVIHTDTNKLRGLGYADPIGHMDFYPNGGYHQVGCVLNPSNTAVIGSVINVTTDIVSSTCDHERSSQYFLESIESTNCAFLSVLCDSHEDYEAGKCNPENSTVAEMGFYTQKLTNLTMPAKFYLRTNASEPFCIGESSIYL